MRRDALPSSSFVDACAAGFSARVTAERKASADRAAELRRRARAAARKLAEHYGLRRVWLFGSLAWGEAHAASDVDLLVEGLAGEAWSTACALVEAEVEAPVDLVRIEEASPGLAARVQAQGILLHGIP